jgi:DtxR family Mn-dependent transcriptional regulator
MIDPWTALLFAGGLTAAAALLFWPERGLVPRLVRGARSTERVLVEDALKHLYNCESRGLPGTLASVSGALAVSGDRTRELLERLMELELVEHANGRFELTADGRSEALRIIRVHRLWERYLSDRTGLPETEWHRVADEREHTTSPEEAAELARETGYPRFDPHGDPIPRPDGEVEADMGLPLTQLEPDILAEIVHIEDEPETTYAQLRAEGLFVGMRVRVLETTSDRCRFEGDGEEHILAPLLAANLTVLRLEEGEVMEGPFETLDQLDLGEHAWVLGISPQCRQMERRRMFDLGLLPGTEVVAELRSPGGDPTAYRIREASIALRREQASMIRISRTSNEEAP